MKPERLQFKQPLTKKLNSPSKIFSMQMMPQLRLRELRLKLMSMPTEPLSLEHLLPPTLNQDWIQLHFVKVNSRRKRTIVPTLNQRPIRKSPKRNSGENGDTVSS